MRRSIREASSNPPSDFASDFARASIVLEEAVHDLLSSGWDELKRRRAYQLGAALCDGAKVAGWKETAGILQAISSLLAMPLEEVFSVQSALREKLQELLQVLKASRQSESA